MRLKDCWRLFFLLLLPVLTIAQQPDDAAKEREARTLALVEQTLLDVGQLKLPENRAHFYAQIGSIVWRRDKERGRALFGKSADDLVVAMQQPDKRSGNSAYNRYSQSTNLRNQVLNLIANHDAEYALELMVRTRPEFITRILATTDAAARPPDAIGETRARIGDDQNYAHFAQNERFMEQNFYRLAAEQNPERAVKILKEALSKGFGNDVFGLLNRLAEKDRAAAAEIAAQLADRLINERFVADGQVVHNNLQLAQSMLSAHMNGGNDPRLKLSDAQMRELAAKLITTYLNDRNLAGYMGQSIVQIAQRFSPASVDLLKKAHPHVFSPGQGQSEMDVAYHRLMNEDVPADQMLAAAAKLPPNQRREVYQAASRKLMSGGNTAGARAILDEFFTDETREQLLSNFDQQLSYNLISQGKFAEAEAAIERLPEPQRIPVLINLANSIFHKNREQNRSYAMSILSKAHALAGERPENNMQMGNVMQVIGGYGNIEPSEAIRIYESLVPKINELTDAAAILQGFQANSNVRDGEFMIVQNDPFGQFGANGHMMAMLANAEFERTMKLIDSFTRSEVRVSMRLQVAMKRGMITSIPMGSNRNVILSRH